MALRIGNVFSAVAHALSGKSDAPPDAPRHEGFLERVKDAFERDALVVGSAAARTLQNAWLSVREHSFAPTIGTPRPNAGAGKPPVILLGGQTDNPDRSMSVFANSLKRDGFKVYVLDDPDHGFESHAVAAQRLDALVDRVRAETGAQKVSLVGYSTGGTNARAYAQLYGGADKVDRVVEMAGSNNGDPEAFGFCDSGREEKLGSNFMKALNADPTRVPTWSLFESGTDGEVVESDARLANGVNNHDVPLAQRHSGGSLGPWSDHIGLPYDGRFYDAAVDALTAG